MSSLNKQYLTEIMCSSNQKLTHENTENIFLQKKINTYKSLFKILDLDEDGEISIFCVDFRKIPTKLIKILQPLINQMKEWGNKYKEHDFAKVFNEMHLFNI